MDTEELSIEEMCVSPLALDVRPLGQFSLVQNCLGFVPGFPVNDGRMGILQVIAFVFCLQIGFLGQIMYGRFFAGNSRPRKSRFAE